MIVRLRILPLLSGGLLLLVAGALPLRGANVAVYRERNEGTVSIDAANVAGNGNLSAYALFDGRLVSHGPVAYPTIGAQLGVAGILQAKGECSFGNFREVGPFQMHLGATLPGNDRLRPFNLGVRGDLYLSTSKDTISLTTDANKPQYNPFFGATLVGDIDWIALRKTFPLKTYLQLSLVDNPQELYRYRQFAVALGAEWKMVEHSFCVDAGTGLYRERRTIRNPAGDRRFEQYYFWVQPGGRYRLMHRFSIVGGLRFAVMQKVKQNNADAITPTLAAIVLRFEAPLYFRETNTEAIRTLVFSEQKSVQRQGLFTEGNKPGMGTSMDFELGIEGSEHQTRSLEESQKELIERRKSIQEKMDEIEMLLEESQ